MPRQDGNTYEARSLRDLRQARSNVLAMFADVHALSQYPTSQQHPGELECQTFGGDKPRTARRSRTDNLTVICDPSVKKNVYKKIITHSGKAHFDVRGR